MLNGFFLFQQLEKHSLHRKFKSQMIFTKASSTRMDFFSLSEEKIYYQSNTSLK